MTPGATVVAHYGFEPWPAAGRGRPSLARWTARTITPDLAAYPVNDLTANVTVPVGQPASIDTASASAAVAIEGAPAQGATAPGLRVAVTLRNPSPRPVWSLYRPSMFSFEVVSPSGRRVSCETLYREPTPFRELFVRLGPGARRRSGLALGDFCPLRTFDESGIYEVTAVFRSSADGEPWLTGRVFTGRIRSAGFVIRVSRGDGRYRPQGLEVSG